MPKGYKGMKLIRAPEDLVSRLSEASNREGKSFIDFVTQALEQALRAHRMNRSLKEIVDFYKLIMMQKEAGLIIVPSETLNRLIEMLYPEKKEVLHEIWFDSGVLYGKYLAAKIKDEDPIVKLEEILKVIGWNLKEVEFKRMDGGSISFKCVSFTLPLEDTVLLMKFIEGVMNSLGYKPVKQDYLRGMIEMEFKRGDV